MTATRTARLALLFLLVLAPVFSVTQPPAPTGVCPYAFLRPTLGEGGAANGALTVLEAEHTLIDNLAALCTATPAEAFPTACPAGSPLEGDGAGGLLCGTDDTGSGAPLPHAATHEPTGSDPLPLFGERVRRLDADGHGDYTSLAAALADLATQPRSADQPWLLLVTPGTYSEPTGLTVPRWVTVACLASESWTDSSWGDDQPCQLIATDAAADFLRLGDSALIGLHLQQYSWATTPVALVAWSPAGGFVLLDGVTLHSTSQKTTGIRFDSTKSDRLILRDTAVFLEGGFETTGLLFDSAGPGWVSGGVLRTSGNGGDVAVDKRGAGDLWVLGTVAETGPFGWTTQYAETGTGSLHVGAAWQTASGDVTPWLPPHAATHAAGAADPLDVTGLPGTLADPQLAGRLADAAATPLDPTSAPADGDVLTYHAATAQATWSPPPAGGTGGGGAGSTLLLYLRDEEPSGTKGGDGTAGTWNVRTLNTVVYDTLTGSTLSANQLTLPADTYRISARAPAARVLGHRLRLWNVTDSQVLALGASAYSDSGADGDQTDAHLFAVLTLAAPTTVELQHWIGSGSSLVGGDLGVGNTDGSPEIYSELWVWSAP